jgi:hypothetical protein
MRRMAGSAWRRRDRPTVCRTNHFAVWRCSASAIARSEFGSLLTEAERQQVFQDLTGFAPRAAQPN